MAAPDPEPLTPGPAPLRPPSQPSAKSTWRRWLLGLVLLAVLALAVGRALQQRQHAQADARAAAQRLQAPVVVELSPDYTLTATVQDLARVVPLSGSVKTSHSAWIKARAAGELQQLDVREGDTVRAGQVLARIDPTEAQARWQQAQLQAEAAAAQLAIAQRTQRNNEALVEQGFISPTALETSRANLQAAHATHQAALVAADIARKALDDTVLRSPLDGVVSSQAAQPGERVGIDARIVEVIDPSALELEAALTPADATPLRPGQTAWLRIDGLPQPLKATVTRLNPATQPSSRSILATLKLPSSPGLRPGLFATGDVIVGRTRGLAIPVSAIRNDRPEPTVQWLRPRPTAAAAPPTTPTAAASPAADAHSDTLALYDIVHQPVRILGSGLAADTPANGEPLVLIENIAEGSILTSVKAGFFQESTTVRLRPEAVTRR